MTTPRGLSRRMVLGASAASLAGSWSTRAAQQMPDFSGAVAWLNSEPLRLQDLRGKVVLVQFWTFTCINWLRTLPYVAAWWDKYKDHGLAIVGVHTPEFSFERDVPNVREATAQLRVGFPVAVDSNMAVWNAFRNGAWPALYLLDASGKLQYRHDGEGEYATTEARIQRLLAEAGRKDVPGGLVQAQGRGAQAPADWARLRSPETYTGVDKGDRFVSPGGMASGARRLYEVPARLAGNTWATAGGWTFGPEVARSDSAGARLVYQYHARDVNLVMGTGQRERPIAFRVRIDGQVPGPAHGSDVDAGGRGVMAERRLYQLVRQPGTVRSRQFEIEFLEPGAEVYAFTFG